MFYLEKRRENVGPLLKYGPKRKPVQTVIDLGADGGLVHISRQDGSRTKFKLVMPDGSEMKLKATSPEEREDWIKILYSEIGEDKAIIQNSNGKLVSGLKEKKKKDKHDDLATVDDGM